MYNGMVGFSEIANIDDGLPQLRPPKLDTMVRIRPGDVQDEEDSEERDLKETRKKYKLKDSRACVDPEYVQWMKNLSMFHQLRERVEDGRAKDKLEDYKLQIVKGLMQKNQILEELEKKVDQMEQGQDPQQAELLKKIEQLELAIAKKKKGGSDPGKDEGKMNQAIDFMMYNMSVLQQMVNNVAQMQKTQMEHVQHTNKVIQSLPQIIAHLNYQTRLEDAQNNQRRDTIPDSQESKQNKKDRKVTIISSSQVGKKTPNPSIESVEDRQSDVEATIKQKMQSSKISSNQLSTKKPQQASQDSPPKGGKLPPIEPDRNLISQSAQAVDSNQFRASALKSREKLGAGGSGNLSPAGRQSGTQSPGAKGSGGSNQAKDTMKPKPVLQPVPEGPSAPKIKRKRRPPEEQDPDNKSQKFGSMSSEFNYTDDQNDQGDGLIVPPDGVKEESMIQSEGGMRGGRDKTGNNTLNNGRNASRRYSRYSDTQLGKDQSSFMKVPREDDVSKIIAERMKKKNQVSQLQSNGDQSKGSKSEKLGQGLILTPILENSQDVAPKPPAQ